MTNQHQFRAAFAMASQAFFEFFEWAYQVSIPPPARQPIEAEMWQGWTTNDRTISELVEFVLAQWDKVLKVANSGVQASLRDQGRKIFQKQFESLETSGRGRVLSALLLVLEQSRPGCTGVSRALAAIAMQRALGPAPSVVSQPPHGLAGGGYGPQPSPGLAGGGYGPQSPIAPTGVPAQQPPIIQSPGLTDPDPQLESDRLKAVEMRLLTQKIDHEIWTRKMQAAKDVWR
jgi:hypothetical protein